MKNIELKVGMSLKCIKDYFHKGDEEFSKGQFYNVDKGTIGWYEMTGNSGAELRLDHSEVKETFDMSEFVPSESLPASVEEALEKIVDDTFKATNWKNPTLEEIERFHGAHADLKESHKELVEALERILKIAKLYKDEHPFSANARPAIEKAAAALKKAQSK